MRSSISLAAGVSIAVLLSGCCSLCEEKKGETVHPSQTATGIDQVVAPTADTGPCVAEQTEPADPTHARVTAGTYCVCDEGDDPLQQHPGTLVASRHLGKGHPVVIGPTTDDAADVVLGATSLIFTSFAQGQELKTFATYDHDPAPASGVQDPGNITHLVKITALKLKEGETVPEDCPADGNIISIDYCYLRQVTKNGTSQAEWACSEDVDGAHFGDIHASN